MKLREWVQLFTVLIPPLSMFAVSFVITVPLTNLQILYLGLPLLIGALVFSAFASKITKIVVTKLGFAAEINPYARISLRKGTYVRDRRRLLMVLLVLVCVGVLGCSSKVAILMCRQIRNDVSRLVQRLLDFEKDASIEYSRLITGFLSQSHRILTVNFLFWRASICPPGPNSLPNFSQKISILLLPRARGLVDRASEPERKTL